MIIVKGTVVGVVDKGEDDKRWAIIGLQTSSKDRDGLDVVNTVKVRVFGDAIKGGLHNAYRQQVGAEVYAPVTIGVNDRYNTVEYLLAGIPLRIQDVGSSSGPKPVESKTA